VGRGDLLFWGGGEGPTILTLESLSKQEKANWLEEASTTHDWVVRCKSKKGAEEIRPFELSGKEIFCDYDKTKSEEVKRKRNGAKKMHIEDRVHETNHGGIKATSNSKRSRFMLGSQRSNCHDQKIAGVVDSSECQSHTVTLACVMLEPHKVLYRR